VRGSDIEGSLKKNRLCRESIYWIDPAQDRDK